MDIARALPDTPAQAPPPPGTLRALWLIGRRGALESIHDRTTVVFSGISALVVPFFLVLGLALPLVDQARDARLAAGAGATLAVYLLTAGLLPSSAAVGIASGQFAGEKEQGNLTPLLATPTSNVAIFAGKVLGSVLPALLYSLIAVVSYLAWMAVLASPASWGLLPIGLALAMLALVPACAIFGAAVASVISSRVRTFNSAQQFAGLALLPVMGGLFGLAYLMRNWGGWALLAGVLGVYLADGALIAAGAATWRREEVLAKQ